MSIVLLNSPPTPPSLLQVCGRRVKSGHKIGHCSESSSLVRNLQVQTCLNHKQRHLCCELVDRVRAALKINEEKKVGQRPQKII